ncbi:MAG TPA: hypothetical protein PLU46_05460 [Thiotrichales bacterium]|nr:hypothetical protein [Thiotrichales bacterium]HQT04421.1 hypothetical protein [Thiotrichales bacterium]
MKEVAGKTGLNLQTLYRTLSDKGNPALQTLTSLLQAFGLRLAVKPENLSYGHA